jgi:hypothetical protein
LLSTSKPCQRHEAGDVGDAQAEAGHWNDKPLHFQLEQSKLQLVEAEPKQIADETAVQAFTDHARIAPFIAIAMGEHNEKRGETDERLATTCPDQAVSPSSKGFRCVAGSLICIG